VLASGTPIVASGTSIVASGPFQLRFPPWLKPLVTPLLTLDFQTCGSIATDSLTLVFPHYNTG